MGGGALLLSFPEGKGAGSILVWSYLPCLEGQSSKGWSYLTVWGRPLGDKRKDWW